MGNASPNYEQRSDPSSTPECVPSAGAIEVSGGTSGTLGGDAQRLKPYTTRDAETQGLHRTLGVLSLTGIGIGCLIGAGIFVITGQAAAKYAGPGLALSFLLSSGACFLTGLCYAELSAAMPVSGSAYAYAYSFVGEGAAWLVGVCLTMEYLFAGAAVAVGWSASMQALLADLGTAIPSIVSAAPVAVDAATGDFVTTGSAFDILAFMITIFLSVVVSYGVKESAAINNAIVVVKVTILVIVVGYGFTYAVWIDPEAARTNLTPFIPPNDGRYGHYGFSGVVRGAGAVFFAYVGFDSICAMAGECKNPTTDVPRGLSLTLIICTCLYVAVTLSLTAMMSYTQLNVAAPVTAALAHVNAPWSLRFLVDFAAVAGLTSVCLVSLMSQPRLVYSMARDGLVPGFIGELHPVYRVPRVAVMGGGCLAAVMGALLPLDVLGELISFGTLVAFIVVCYTVLVKRRTRPDMPSPFLVPFAPYVPVTGMVVCFLQLLSLPPATVRNFAFVLVAAALYYALYGRFNSRALSPDLAVAIVAEEEARIARAANGADDAPKIDTGSIGK